MRNTGNRGIEALHSIFRGGSCNLPITSPNLSFQEFLSKMNKVMQIKKSEHWCLETRLPIVRRKKLHMPRKAMRKFVTMIHIQSHLHTVIL